MSSKATRQVLVGKQTVAGTGVNVDVALHATSSVQPMVDKIHPEEDIGSFAPSRHYIGSIRPQGQLVLPDAVYEEILIPLSMALGEPTPSAGPPYTWTFTLANTTASGLLAFCLWTLEYTADVNTYLVRAEDVFAKSLTIEGVAGKGWKVTADLDGGEVTLPAALSATPAIDDTVTPIRMAETLLYVDTTWAGIGVTNVEELIQFTWKLEEYQHAKQFAGSLYPNGRGNGRYKMTLELILEVSAPEAQTFADAILATTQYAVQIKGLVDANDSCKINGMYMVEEVSTLDDRDGNNTIKITLLGEKDASDNTGAVVVVTDVAAL